jgi:large subunit ribosomal protein L20
MTRVKRGNVARKRRKKILNFAKGFRGSLSKLFRPAHQVVLHALSNSYKDRRLKKRDFRGLWIARINAALGERNLSYSKFMGNAKKQEVLLNRKVLSEIAISYPDTFDAITKVVEKES